MNTELALELMIQLGLEIGKISSRITEAKAEARDISDEEMQQIRADNDAARAQFAATLAALPSTQS